MQVTEVNRQITCSGEMVTEYMAGKLAVRLTGTFGD